MYVDDDNTLTLYTTFLMNILPREKLCQATPPPPPPPEQPFFFRAGEASRHLPPITKHPGAAPVYKHLEFCVQTTTHAKVYLPPQIIFDTWKGHKTKTNNQTFI